MSTRMKYGSLSKALGEKFSKLSSPRKTESPSFKSKKRDISDELTNGLKKLSGSKNITPDMIEWINTIELNDKENVSSKNRLEQLKKEKEREREASPRRGSQLKKVEASEGELPKKGKLYIRVAEVKHKLKQPKDERVIYCTVSVLQCTLATSPVEFKNSVSFEEGFLFDILGDFAITLEVFSQAKNRDESENFQMPESLGTLTFNGLSVLPVEMLTGEYYLNKDGVDTQTSITLQFAIKIQEDEELEREKLPEPDFSGNLSRQVPGLGGGYNWIMDECELRGRTLRFYNENNQVKKHTLDYRSKIEKKKEAESGEILPYNCFQILVSGEQVILMAQTKEEREAWIEALSKAALSAF